MEAEFYSGKLENISLTTRCHSIKDGQLNLSLPFLFLSSFCEDTNFKKTVPNNVDSTTSCVRHVQMCYANILIPCGMK